ncbi:MAG: hypothetical protein FJ405_05260 [Verrucomicrobia bacterium]|nr:hypothetical protein [Verrucomicrobiota bacterium]
MNALLLLAGRIAIVGSLLAGVVHVLAADSSAPNARGDISITSEGGLEHLGDALQVIYKQNVVVRDPVDNPRTVIFCDWLSIQRSPDGRSILEIGAATNVTIHMMDSKGTNVLKGDRAVWTPTNDLVVVTGNPPVLETPQSILTGEKLMIFDRKTGGFQSPGRVETRIRQSGVAPFLSSTNRATAPKPQP